MKEPPENHTKHEWDEGQITTTPTCTEKGIKTFTCWCTEKYTETVDELGHDKEMHDKQDATCVAVGWESYETCKRDGCDYNTYQETAINPDNHLIEDEACTACGKKFYSEGLGYTLSDDGTYYSVKGIGECKDTEIVIPSTYKGLTVTSIGDFAFSRCDNLTKVVIGDSVTSIGRESFSCCYSLTEIVIPESVTSIGYEAFSCCINLTEIILPDSVTSIDVSAFYYCRSLTEVVIPDSVTSIGGVAFHCCDNLTKVVIGDSVMSIGDGTFDGCSSLTSITFNGTVAQWNAIEKGYLWNIDVPATEVICTNGRASI